MRRAIASLALLAMFNGGCGSSTQASDEKPAPAQQPAAAEEPAAAEAPAPTGGRCGNKGQPDCPLQRWMKSTLQTYQRSGDHERLARAFRELAAHTPAGFDTWKAQSERGAKLAASKDAEGIKQVCKDCHQDHRARYRRELREAPVW